MIKGDDKMKIERVRTEENFLMWEVKNKGEVIGDIKTNQITKKELIFLADNFSNFLCPGGHIWESEFRAMIAGTAGILIFRDINGNFGENFTISNE